MKPQPGAGRGDIKEKQKHKIKEKYTKEKGGEKSVSDILVRLVNL